MKTTLNVGDIVLCIDEEITHLYNQRGVVTRAFSDDSCWINFPDYENIVFYPEEFENKLEIIK